MNVDFTSEQIASITALAERNGRSVAELMAETASWLAQSEEGYKTRLKRSVEEADRDEFVEEDEMDARVAQMLQSR